MFPSQVLEKVNSTSFHASRRDMGKSKSKDFACSPSGKRSDQIS